MQMTSNFILFTCTVNHILFLRELFMCNFTRQVIREKLVRMNKLKTWAIDNDLQKVRLMNKRHYCIIAK